MGRVGKVFSPERRTAAWWSELKIDEADQWIIDEYAIERRNGPGRTCQIFARSRVDGKCTALARIILQAPEGVVADHINGDPLDNRRENLRLANLSDNAANKRKKGCANKFKGVIPQASRFRTQVMKHGTIYRAGPFNSEVEAARAYDALARKHHGEFACVNFPNEGEQGAHRTVCASAQPPSGLPFHTSEVS